MTADFYHYDMSFLGNTATRIINEVRGINCVVYNLEAAGHDRVGNGSRLTPHRRNPAQRVRLQP